MTTISSSAPRAIKDPLAKSSHQPQRVDPHARSETIRPPLVGEELAKRHRLIEVLLSRHEKIIDIRFGNFIKKYPEIGEDAVRSTFYLKLVKRCIHRDDLAELQTPELLPLDPEREGQIIGGMIKFTRHEELKRLCKAGRLTRAFSQLDEYNPGQIADKASSAPQPDSPKCLAVRISDRLHELGIELNDRQFNIILCRVQNGSDSGKLTTYEQTSSQLGISCKTVAREMAKISQMLLTARGVTEPTNFPATIARREDYKLILETKTNLRPAMREFFEAYIALSKDGKRPTEAALMEALRLTPGQLKSRQRVAARLRPGLLGEIAA